MTSVGRGDPAYAGQAIYTRGFLSIYDTLVYRFNSPVLWRCSKSQMLELYNANVSIRHLDIGVGTGKLLDECRFPAADPQITLMDLNPNSLAVAARRLERYKPVTHRANVLEPWEVPQSSFESIGLCNLLHCLPGAIADKAVVFEHARAALTPGGVLFGATILGDLSKHRRIAHLALKANNRVGVMSNLNDTIDGLDAVLSGIFRSHEIAIQGTVALFTART